MNLRIPSRDSAIAKAIRVAIYQVIMAGILMLQDAQTVEAIAKYYPAITTIAIIVAPVASFIYNLLRKDVPNY